MGSRHDAKVRNPGPPAWRADTNSVPGQGDASGLGCSARTRRAISGRRPSCTAQRVGLNDAVRGRGSAFPAWALCNQACGVEREIAQAPVAGCAGAKARVAQVGARRAHDNGIGVASGCGSCTRHLDSASSNVLAVAGVPIAATPCAIDGVRQILASGGDGHGVRSGRREALRLGSACHGAASGDGYRAGANGHLHGEVVRDETSGLGNKGNLRDARRTRCKRRGTVVGLRERTRPRRQGGDAQVRGSRVRDGDGLRRRRLSYVGLGKVQVGRRSLCTGRTRARARRTSRAATSARARRACARDRQTRDGNAVGVR